MEENKIRMNFLTLLPVILPLVQPILKNIVGDSGAKQLVDLLDKPEAQSILTSLMGSMSSKSNNDRIIELLLNKIPDPISDKDRLENLEIQIANIMDMLVKKEK